MKNTKKLEKQKKEKTLNALVKKLDRQLPQKVLKLQLKKYLSTKKMQNKKPPAPFNFQELANTESIVYEEPQVRHNFSKKVPKLLQTKYQINIKK